MYTCNICYIVYFLMYINKLILSCHILSSHLTVVVFLYPLTNYLLVNYVGDFYKHESESHA